MSRKIRTLLGMWKWRYYCLAFELSNYPKLYMYTDVPLSLGALFHTSSLYTITW
jgi:hypothetical protein